MVKADPILEVEIDTAKNSNLYLGMVQRTLRGRFDILRAMKHDKAASELLSQWPNGVPGQRLALNLDTAEGAIIEPLHHPEHSTTRELIESKGMSLEPERVTFSGVHLPTWLYWMSSAVRSGKAKLLRGTLPDKIEGTPQKRFHSQEHVDPLDKLTSVLERQSQALERQGDLIAQLLAKLVK